MGVIYAVGAKARVDRLCVAGEDLIEIKEQVILEPKSPDCSFPPFVGALELPSRAIDTTQIRLTRTYDASLCRNGNRQKGKDSERSSA